MKTVESNKNYKGFTIVELLIATAILTTVLIAASFVIVQVGRLYYKGNITSKTQESARNLIDSISRPIQLQGASIVANSGVLCVGTQRYTYQTSHKVDAAHPHAIWRDTVVNQNQCATGANLNLARPTPDGESMLSENMRLFSISVSPVDPDTGISIITVEVGYGDSDVFETDPVTGRASGCRGQAAGGQFCAFVSYNTAVSPRIRQL